MVGTSGSKNKYCPSFVSIKNGTYILPGIWILHRILGENAPTGIGTHDRVIIIGPNDLYDRAILEPNFHFLIVCGRYQALRDKVQELDAIHRHAIPEHFTTLGKCWEHIIIDALLLPSFRYEKVP